MAESISEAATAARERFLKKKPAADLRRGGFSVPGSYTAEDEQAAAAEHLRQLAAPAEGTSSGTGTEYTSGKPERKKSNWKRNLGEALQAASYGITANIGPSVPGQELSQGVLRGIVGAGMGSAARARAEALAEGREQGLSGKLALLAAKKEGEPTWEEKFTKTEAGKMERLKAQRVSTEEIARIKGGMSDEDFAKINLEAQKVAAKRFPYRTPSEREMWDVVEEVKKYTYSGRGMPKKPEPKLIDTP